MVAWIAQLEEELMVKTAKFSRMEEFLRQLVVETRRVCEEEAHDVIHDLKERLSQWKEVSGFSSASP